MESFFLNIVTIVMFCYQPEIFNDIPPSHPDIHNLISYLLLLLLIIIYPGKLPFELQELHQCSLRSTRQPPETSILFS